MKKSQKKKAEKRDARRMIPWTNGIAKQMSLRVNEILCEYGMLNAEDCRNNPEATADHLMAVLDAQNITRSDNVIVGRCLLLPQYEGGFSLLTITPILADEKDAAGRWKPSPVRFDRTPEDEVILPAHWLRDRLAELAENPRASEQVRTWARTMSRCGTMEPIVAPAMHETAAVTIRDNDGTERIVEALPPGTVLSFQTEPTQ